MASSSFYEGASQIINNGGVHSLGRLKCLGVSRRMFWTNSERRASANGNNMGEERVSPLTLTEECQRYFSVFIPCLRLILSLFATCPDHRRLHNQVLVFLDSHKDAVDKILTLGVTNIPPLRCTKLLLSVYYHLYCGPLYSPSNPRSKETIAIRSKEAIFFSLLQIHTERLTEAPIFDGRELDLNLDLDLPGSRDSRRGEDVEMLDIERRNREDLALALPSDNIKLGRNEENEFSQIGGETISGLRHDIIKVLLNIFRLKCMQFKEKKVISFTPIFSPTFTASSTTSSTTSSTNPSLTSLCKCIKNVQNAATRLSRYISALNGRLENFTNVEIKEIQITSDSMPSLQTKVRLYFDILENLLTLLYFHSQFFLANPMQLIERDFYGPFRVLFIFFFFLIFFNTFLIKNSKG